VRWFSYHVLTSIFCFHRFVIIRDQTMMNCRLHVLLWLISSSTFYNFLNSLREFLRGKFFEEKKSWWKKASEWFVRGSEYKVVCVCRERERVCVCVWERERDRERERARERVRVCNCERQRKRDICKIGLSKKEYFCLMCDCLFLYIF